MYAQHPIDHMVFGALVNFCRWIQGKFWELITRYEEMKEESNREVNGLTLDDVEDSIEKTKNAVVEQTGMDEKQQEFLDFIFESLKADLSYKLEGEDEK